MPTDQIDPIDYSLVPTIFDRSRLNEMEIGDSLNSESGLWSVNRYKDHYFLIANIPKKSIQKEFKQLNDLIGFLERN